MVPAGNWDSLGRREGNSVDRWWWDAQPGSWSPHQTLSLANPLLLLAHDFILNPFLVLFSTTFLTWTFLTPASSALFPSLPMLHPKEIDQISYTLQNKAKHIYTRCTCSAQVKSRPIHACHHAYVWKPTQHTCTKVDGRTSRSALWYALKSILTPHV